MTSAGVTSPPAAARAAGGRRRRRAAAALLAVVVVAAAVAAVVASGVGGDGEPTQGPLEGAGIGGNDADSKAGWPRTAGGTFVFALPIVVNTGDQPAVLERIGVEKLPAGLDVLHTYVIGPERKVSIVFENGWPSKSGHYKGIKPVRGYTLAPRTQGNASRGIQLVYVVRADAPGEYVFDAVTVDYRVGDTEHRARIEHGLVACIFPKDETPTLERCDAWKNA